MNLEPTDREDAAPEDVTELSDPPAAERHRGWHDALDPAGVAPVTGLAAFRPAEAAHEVALRLLDRPDRPTALLCFSDAFAVQAVRAAESLGPLVPGDLSVVGFDDSSLATAVRPALTTLRQPVAEKGRPAVRTLFARMAGEEVPWMRTVLPSELVVRDSTGPAPAEIRWRARGSTSLNSTTAAVAVRGVGLAGARGGTSGHRCSHMGR